VHVDALAALGGQSQRLGVVGQAGRHPDENVVDDRAPGGDAHADATDGTCPASGVIWTLSTLDPNNPNSFIWVGEQEAVTSVTPTFFVAESHEVQNNTNTTATGSFTSTVAKTFSYTVGGSVSGSFFDLVTAGVSGSITQSTTTTTGVTASAPIPPGGVLIGQYGVAGYAITVTSTQYYSLGDYNSPTAPDAYCAWDGNPPTTANIQAPTFYTGWRIIPG
jgi:hypothetical protein